MDETGARALLERIANTEAPAARVDIDRAIRAGRRRLRRRRASAAGASAVAVAAVIALITGVITPAGGRGSHAGPPASGSSATASSRPAVAPREFNPLRPYAFFGWLPAGYSTSSAPSATLLANTTSTTLTAAAGESMINLTIVTAGSCRVTGLAVLRYLRLWHSSGGAPVLSCYAPAGWAGTSATGSSWQGKAASPAEPVAGRPALWIGEPTQWRGQKPLADTGTLAWEYAAGAWAILTGDFPSHAVSVGELRQLSLNKAKGHLRQGTAVTLTPSQRAQLLRIARNVRYQATEPILFPFRLAGRPAGWPVAGSAFEVSGGLMLDTNLEFSASGGPDTLQVSAAPASGSPSCGFIAGQSESETVEGSPVLFRYIDQPGKYVQTLCANDVHGLAVYIELDLDGPATVTTPLAGESALTQVFRQMHLLGPDPAGWTSSPVS
jgi:hypothetical protein